MSVPADPAPISLFDLPHDEARRLLSSAGAPVYLFVNPVEYHGPHLPLHNDRIIAHGIARDLARALAARRGWPMIVAEDLEIGVEPTPGPGSRPTPFAEAREQIREACRALVELGARKVVLMTFHGAPLHAMALEAGVEECEALGARAVQPFNRVLRELVHLDDPTPYAEAVAGIADPRERARVLAALPHDFHAGFFETSLTLRYAPSSVSPRHRDLPDSPAPVPVPAIALAARAAKAAGRAELARELTFASIGRGWLAARPFLGYTSAPRHASPEAGAVFARIIVEKYLPLVENVLDGKERSPAPILRWTAWVGRRASGLRSR